MARYIGHDGEAEVVTLLRLTKLFAVATDKIRADYEDTRRRLAIRIRRNRNLRRSRLRDELAKSKRDLEHSMQTLLEEQWLKLKSEAVVLALDVTKRVLGTLPEVISESLPNRLHEALRTLDQNSILRIRIHPDSQSVIRGDQFKSPIIHDSSLTPGSSVVELRSGQIELNCFDHLEAIAEQLSEGTYAGNQR